MRKIEIKIGGKMKSHNHDEPDNCWCNPTIIPVEGKDGVIHWITAHNEPNQTADKLAERAICIFQAMEELKNAEID